MPSINISKRKGAVPRAGIENLLFKAAVVIFVLLSILLFLLSHTLSFKKMDISIRDEKKIISQNAPVKNSWKESEAEWNNNYEILRFEHEDSFRKTFRSCIPSPSSPKEKGCIERKVKDPSGNNDVMTRIAIFSPPGEIGDTFFDYVEALLEEEQQQNKGSQNNNIKLVRETHVPPYGYGGNHGYTKAIRLMMPLATTLLDTSDEIDFFPEDFGAENEREVLAIFRQIIRWHCRLSHFAAHTALLTVDLQHLLFGNGPKEEQAAERSIVSFILNDTTMEEQQPNINEIQTRVKIIELQDITYAAMETVDVLGIFKDKLGNTLLDELERTNHLKDWPCLSFMDAAAAASNNDTSPSRVLAKFLVPDCQSQFVKCTIARDLCEFNGDVACNK